MPHSYASSIIVAAHNAVLASIDSDVNPAAILAYTGAQPANADAAATGTLLGTITLADPSGTVNQSTGQITIDAVNSVRDEAADASGTIGYVRVVRGDGSAVLDLPVQAGTSPVSGYAVFNTLTVVAGGPIELVSMTIG